MPVLPSLLLCGIVEQPGESLSYQRDRNKRMNHVPNILTCVGADQKTGPSLSRLEGTFIGPASDFGRHWKQRGAVNRTALQWADEKGQNISEKV
jgi:hypothetical protein